MVKPKIFTIDSDIENINLIKWEYEKIFLENNNKNIKEYVYPYTAEVLDDNLSPEYINLLSCITNWKTKLTLKSVKFLKIYIINSELTFTS